MPTRLIREGIISSDRVDSLDWAAEVFYRRLLNKVDDFGLYDARPSVLRSSLYPLRVDRVREADCSRWLAMCETAGLIVLYEADSKPYLKVLDTKWKVRSDPKYPTPPANSCNQLKTVAPVVVVVDVGEDGKKPPPKNGRRKPKTAIPEGFGVSERIAGWAAKRGIENLDRHLEAFVSKCKSKDYRYVDWDEAFMGAIRDDWAKIGNGARRVAI